MMIESSTVAVQAVFVSPAHEQALKFASMGIPVFPVHGVVDGVCTCRDGAACKQAGKHPSTAQGFKDATTTPHIINMWFTYSPSINYGVRTGVPLPDSDEMVVVIDVDDYKADGYNPLDAIESEHGKLPESPEVLTGGGGRHLYYKVPAGLEFTGTLGACIDFKVNGYVIGPGSVHKSGRSYVWEASSDLFEGEEIPSLPSSMVTAFSKRAVDKQACVMANEPAIQLSEVERERIQFALRWVEADDYDIWVKVLMALKSTGDDLWAFDVADKWSKRSSKYEAEAMIAKWRSITKDGGISIGTLFHFAEEAQAEAAAKVKLDKLIETLTAGANVANSEWPEPQAFSDSMKAAAYPLAAMPTKMREAVIEVQKSVQAPMAMVAMSALASLSLATQGLFNVQRAHGLHGPVSLFLLTIADSGERKSTLDSYFAQPVRDHERKSAKEAAPLISQYNADMASWNAVAKGYENKIIKLAQDDLSPDTFQAKRSEHELKRPVRPMVPRLIFKDTTPEALVYAIAYAWPSVGILSSEGGAFFGGHGMSEQSQMRYFATINELWDGKEMRTDRRTSDSHMTEGRLTVAIQVQSQTLKTFMNASGDLARGTGFMARFLIAWPESTQGTRRFIEPSGEMPKLAAFQARLQELLQMRQPVEPGRVIADMLHLSPAAKATWIEFHDSVELQLGRGGPYEHVRDAASKIADNAARIAALFHIVQAASGDISEADMQSACLIAGWHLAESRRLLAKGAPLQETDAMKLEAWLIKKFTDQGITSMEASDVQRYGPSHLRKKEALTPVLDELVSMGRVKITDGASKKVMLNPALLPG